MRKNKGSKGPVKIHNTRVFPKPKISNLN